MGFEIFSNSWLVLTEAVVAITPDFLPGLPILLAGVIIYNDDCMFKAAIPCHD